MRVKMWLCALCALVSIGFSWNALAAPESGWWWNSAESGRGWFIEIKGKTLFMAGYFYAEDGRGTWAVSGGPITDLNNYTGRLLTACCGQTLVGPYMPWSNATDIGEVKLSFTDPTHGTLTWPGGVVQIERQIFGGGIAPFQPTGWWWNANQSGRGFSIEVQGNLLDVVGFMYDGAGNPVWYLSAGPMSSPTHYTGNLLQFSGGQTMSGPYKVPTATPIGSITIDFTSLTTGTMTLSDAAATALGLKSSVTIDITPQLDPPPLADLPGKWGGTFTGHAVYDPPGTDTLTADVDGNVTWIEAATNNYPPTATPNRAYVISGGTATLTYSGNGTFTVLGQPLNCTVSGTTQVALAQSFANSYLQFEADGTVTGQIASSNLVLPVTGTCQTPFGSVALNNQIAANIAYPVHGRHKYNYSSDTQPFAPVAGYPNLSASATWYFTGLP
jgi:hypothetical protein